MGLLRVHFQPQRNHVGHQAGGLPIARVDASGHRHCQHQIFRAGAAVVIGRNQRNQHLRQTGAVLLAERTQTHHLLRRKLPGATQQPGGQMIARPRQRRRRRQIGQLLHPVLAVALEPIGVAIVLFHFEQRQRTAVLRRLGLHVGHVGVIEHSHALHHDRRAIAVHHQMAHALHPDMMIFTKTEHRAVPERPVLQIFRLANFFVDPMFGGVAWSRVRADVEIRNRAVVLGQDHLRRHALVLDDAQSQRVELLRQLHAGADQHLRVQWAEHFQHFGQHQGVVGVQLVGHPKATLRFGQGKNGRGVSVHCVHPSGVARSPSTPLNRHTVDGRRISTWPEKTRDRKTADCRQLPAIRGGKAR